MLLAHLTDPHLTVPPSWRSLPGRSHRGKRYLGYLSWARKRRHALRREWLDDLGRALRERPTDLLLLTGDLTQIGTPEEIVQARGWLAAFASPEEMVLVPGNHDAYAAESRPALFREWAAYLPEGGASGFPLVRRVDDVAVFGLCSAVPSAPFSAAGAIGEAQLGRLREALRAHRDAFRVLMLHHPPLPGMISPRKRLTDAASLADVLEQEGVHLVVHGHRHRNQRSERLGARVFCTAPASAREASFRRFEIVSGNRGWHVQAELLVRRGPGRFEVADREGWEVSGPG